MEAVDNVERPRSLRRDFVASDSNKSSEVTLEMETSIQEHEHAAIEVVSARLNYLAEATPKPVNFAYDPPAGVPRRSGKYVERSVVIHNGREDAR